MKEIKVKEGAIWKTTNSVIITIPEYATHVKQSSKKYIKVNGQTLYSGMNHHTRNKVVREMKDSIINALPYDMEDLSEYIPFKINLEIHNVPNYQTVKYMSKKGEFSFKGVDPTVEYEPTFDVDNQWIWIKCFTDVIAKDLNLIVDDTVKYIPINGEIEYVPIDKLEDRKLVFTIERITDVNKLDNLEKFYGKY